MKHNQPEETGDKSLRCGEPLYSFGVDDFRLGGTTGGGSSSSASGPSWAKT